MADDKTLAAMNRDELDERAAALGIDPSEYRRADDLRHAIADVEAAVDLGIPEVAAQPEPGVEAPAIEDIADIGGDVPAEDGGVFYIVNGRKVDPWGNEVG